MRRQPEDRPCTRCNKVLPREMYYTLSWGSRYPYCKGCAKKHSKGWKVENRERSNAWARANRPGPSKRWRIENKRRVFDHYGRKCVCCGESEPVFLTIDHIDGGGGKQRKANNWSGGHNIYRWLIKHNFPQGFRTLCMNCNWGRGKNGGVCPHELKAKMVVLS